MSAQEPYPGTQAVLRAIALLKAFTDDRPELSLADLARRVELNKTTTYRLLTALESEGLVIRSTDADTYRLGPEMIALGGRALRANDLRLVSRDELETLAQTVGEAATLEVLVGAEVLILDEAPVGHLVSPNQSIGTRWPAHATSTGKVLLANLPPADLETVLQTPLVKLTEMTVTGPDALRRQLVAIREQGYAVVEQELEIGFTAIGAAIRDHNGRAAAAISVNGPSARLDAARVPEVGRLVKAAANRISARLGFKLPEPAER